MSETGIEIRIARIRRNMKQSEVSDATGIPQCTISRIENGAAEDHREQTAVLKRYLGIGTTCAEGAIV